MILILPLIHYLNTQRTLQYNFWERSRKKDSSKLHEHYEAGSKFNNSTKSKILKLVLQNFKKILKTDIIMLQCRFMRTLPIWLDP